MLTAKSQLEDKLEGLEAGADDYITKPFSFKELIMRVKTVLRRYNKVQEEKIVLKDLTMDLKDFKVFYKGKAINLTPKEFELLKSFSSKPKQNHKKRSAFKQSMGHSLRLRFKHRRCVCKKHSQQTRRQTPKAYPHHKRKRLYVKHRAKLMLLY